MVVQYPAKLVSNVPDCGELPSLSTESPAPTFATPMHGYWRHMSTEPTIPTNSANTFRHFDDLYAANPDPWGYKSEWYEERRFALLTAMLDRKLYDRVFEPGCSNAVLTAALLPRCHSILAVDGSENAVALARQTMSQFPQVEIYQAEVPTDWPEGTFDLIVLSDFLYYLTPANIRTVAELALSSLRRPGTILAGHWKGRAHDFLTSGGEAVHGMLCETLGPPTGAFYSDTEQVMTTWIL
jgi:SAM-dependent methyltransferase